MLKKELSEIKGFETCSGYYIYSNGHIYSDRKMGFLKPLTDSKGYKYVDLRGRKPAIRNPKIHKLVMLAFSDEVEREQINHIDGDKSNNDLSNLEYVTNEENRVHALNTGLKDEIDYWISQHDLNGNVINVFRTAKEALEYLGAPPNSGNIGRVIRGKRKTAYGFVWKQYEGSTTRA